MAAGGAPDFSSVQLRPVAGYQAIVDFLRKEMSLGRIRPGDRLPSERTLAQQLGVARETLRQALRILEGSGQIVVVRGATGGPIVKEAVLDERYIRDDVIARADEIFALVEFRTVVESATAALAAERHTAVDIEAMEQAQHELRSAQSKSEARNADTAFHLAIAVASGNSFMRGAVEDARVRMFEPVDLLSFDLIQETSWAAHASILQAIRQGLPAEASEAMRLHLSMTADEFAQIIRPR